MLALIASVMLVGSTEAPKQDQALTPVEFNDVVLSDRFWAPRLKTQQDVLVPFAFEKVKPSIDNLAKTAAFLAGDTSSKPTPQRYIASDLYKIMEGAAYILQSRRDSKLEAQMDSIIEVIAAAQAPDGYHYESHITGVAKDYRYGYWGGAGMGDKPYSWVLHSHELYNMGHMYEGAVAYYRATGKRTWLDVAIKNARHVNQVFFYGDPNYNQGRPVNQAPGHQEIELALVKLYRATGDTTYLQMAKRFLDIRGVTYHTQGQGVMSGEYSQQHLPVRQQFKPTGHSVRAMYMYSAMADVSGLCNDPTLRPALDSVWQNIVDTRMHITGGLGAIHGIEGFGPEYLLPNKEAYLETCAAVGNVLFNYRMFLATNQAKYVDVAEVALFNNVLAGVNLEGNKFFYVNPLEADGTTPFNHGKTGRSPWFGTACCPSNLARLIPQVSGMMYATSPRSLYVALYATSRSEPIAIGKGSVVVSQQSNYPFEGRIRLTIEQATTSEFDIRLRIPSWVGDQLVPGALYRYIDNQPKAVTVAINGKAVPYSMEQGFAVLHKRWKKGDVVELVLPMDVRFSVADARVEADRGRVAVSRGPLVYCGEAIDNPNNLLSYTIDQSVIDGSKKVTPIDQGPLEGIPSVELSDRLKLIPYYAWNNRGDMPMLVWFARQAKYAALEVQKAEARSPFKQIRASFTYPNDSAQAIGDGQKPRSSADNTIARWTSFPQLGKEQTIEIELNAPTAVRSIGVYWYQDQEQVKLPKEWSVSYRTPAGWQPFEIYTTDQYNTWLDQFNVIHPAQSLTTDALRINILPQPNAAVGILEVEVQKE